MKFPIPFTLIDQLIVQQIIFYEYLDVIIYCFYVTEPDDGGDRKKKTLKAKIKGSKSTAHNDNKPNISYPTNFEHTVHVGFDAVTGEFTVSINTCNYFLFNIVLLTQNH